MILMLLLDEWFRFVRRLRIVILIMIVRSCRSGWLSWLVVLW